MLVLTRRVGEQILINKGEIEVKVLYEHNGIITLIFEILVIILHK